MLANVCDYCKRLIEDKSDAQSVVVQLKKMDDLTKNIRSQKVGDYHNACFDKMASMKKNELFIGWSL